MVGHADSAKRTDYWVRLRWKHGGGVCGARQSEAPGGVGKTCGRTVVDDHPGGEFSRLSGRHQRARLVENIKKQAENFGAEYVHGDVLDAELLGHPFRINVEGEWIETRTVIVASGASARWLGLESSRS
jgi:hypothetical protein